MACFGKSSLVDLLPRPDWEASSLRLWRSIRRRRTTKRRAIKGSRCQDPLHLCAQLLPEKGTQDSVCRMVLCFFIELESNTPSSKLDGPGIVGKCHQLAPVLGIIEDIDSNPAEAAWRTVMEQTALPATSLSVYRHGKPFISKDPLSIERQCVIYPFAFHKDNGSEENCIGGIHVGNFGAFLETDLGNISYIHEGLRNVWFEADLGPTSGKALATGLRQLQQDHESGARKLAAISLSVLQAVLEHLEDPISLDGPWWQKTRLAAWHLWKNGRPSMDAAIVSFLLLTLGEIATSLSSTNNGPFCRYSRVHGAFDSMQKMMRSYTTRISRNLASYMRSKDSGNRFVRRRSTFTVLTLSASSTIRECIVHSALASRAPYIDVRVLESRPLFEGVSMAGSIISSLESLPSHQNGTARPQVRVTIYTDASVAQAATGADLLLLGADRISADGSVSNKTGSVPAALSIRHMAPGAETIVVSEIYKVAMQTANSNNNDTEEHVIMENNEASEVMEAWEQDYCLKGLDVIQDRLESHDSDSHAIGIAHAQPPQLPKQPTVNVQNVYFEWVPPSLIDTYICEDGMKTAVDFQRQSQWVSEQCDLLFGRY